MSDFLGRLAARSLGQGANARPRLRHRFEETPLVGDTPDVVETGLAAAPTAAMPAPRDGLARAAPHVPATAVPESSTARKRTDSPPHPSRPESAFLVETGSLPAIVADSAERARESTPRPPAPSRARGRQSTTGVVAAVPPRRAVPVPAPRGTPVAATVAAREGHEPPPVRVHIGRLEVRANVEPPQRPVQSERPRQPELSLAEYLRGRRIAR